MDAPPLKSLWPYLLAPLRPGAALASSRVAELDGMRGWASLGVVCYHVFWETLFFRAPEMRNVLTGVLFDGGLAVSLFFVLSGEALAQPHFQGKGDAVVRALALKRYTRLAIPVFASCVLVWALGAAGAIYVREAANIAGRHVWLTGWLEFPLTLPGLARYSLFDAFSLVRPAQEWNPFLWTMGVELDGSLLVFAILLFARDIRGARGLVLAAAVALALAPFRPAQNVSCFLVGLLFADLRASGGFAALQTSDRQRVFAALLAILMLMAGVAALNGDHDYKNLKAFGILLLVFAMPSACAFLRAPLSQALGRISFPLYLLQFAVIVGPMSAAITAAEARGVLGRGMAYAIGLGAVALCLAAAAAFLPVERFTARVGEWVVRLARYSQPSVRATPRLRANAGSPTSAGSKRAPGAARRAARSVASSARSSTATTSQARSGASADS